MINRKSESVKLLESIQITLKEGRNPPLTPKEINQIKSSLNYVNQILYLVVFCRTATISGVEK